MNTKEEKKNQKDVLDNLKRRYAILTDNELMFEENKKEEMLGKIQLRLGKTKEEVHKIIAEIQTSFCFCK